MHIEEWAAVPWEDCDKTRFVFHFVIMEIISWLPIFLCNIYFGCTTSVALFKMYGVEISRTRLCLLHVCCCCHQTLREEVHRIDERYPSYSCEIKIGFTGKNNNRA